MPIQLQYKNRKDGKMKTEFKTTQQLRKQLQETRKQRSQTTKFKITMEIEVVDVGDVPADVLALRESIRKSTENISSGNIDVITIYVEKTGATGVTPKDTRHGFGNSTCHSLVE